MDTKVSSEAAAYSIPEAMRRLGISRDLIYRAINSGGLKARKLGRRTLITDDDLRAFLAALPTIGEGGR
jgi:excisionase family DNA binding protein